MPFCVTDTSLIPRFCPLFVVKEVEGHPILPCDPRDIRKVILEACFPLDADSKPSDACVPRYAICESAHKTLPDFFHVEGRTCVSQTLKDAIERLERGVHQFFPIDLCKKNKQPFDGKYFILNILNQQESLIFEESSLRKSYHSESGFVIVSEGTIGRSRRTLAADRLRGNHLWRESIMMSNIYISDELGDLIKSGKLMGFGKNEFFRVFLK